MVRSPQAWQGRGGGRRWDTDLSVHGVGGAPPRLLQGWARGDGGSRVLGLLTEYRALVLSESEH